MLLLAQLLNYASDGVGIFDFRIEFQILLQFISSFFILMCALIETAKISMCQRYTITTVLDRRFKFDLCFVVAPQLDQRHAKIIMCGSTRAIQFHSFSQV